MAVCRALFLSLFAVATLALLSAAPAAAAHTRRGKPTPTAALVLAVSGLPKGVAAAITVRGPDGFHKQTPTTQTWRGLAPGTYVVSVHQVVIRHRRGHIKPGSVAIPNQTLTPVRVRADRVTRVSAAYGTIRNANVRTLSEVPRAVIGPASAPRGLVLAGHSVPVGTVLASAPTSALPDGLLAIVTSTHYERGATTVMLRPAKLWEVFPSLDYNAAIEISPQSSSLPPAAHAAGRRSNPVAHTTQTSSTSSVSLGQDDIDQAFAKAQEECGANRIQELSPKLGVSLKVEPELHWTWLPPEPKGKLKVRLTGSAGLKISVGEQVTCKLRTEALPGLEGTVILDVFGVPVPIRWEVYIQGRLHASAAFHANAEADVEIIAQTEAPYVTAHKNLLFENELDVAGEVGVAPVIRAEIPVIEAFVAAGPEIALAGKLAPNPQCELDLNLVLEAGIFGHHAIDSTLPIFAPGGIGGPLYQCETPNGPKYLPEDVEAPALSTTSAKVGTTISVSNGEWTGSSPLTYSYQWYDCPGPEVNPSCASIAGATNNTYTVTSGEVGKSLGAIVTAANVAGATSADSSASSPVPPPIPPPENTAPPQLSSITASQGTPISVSTGTWASEPQHFSYQWLSCPSRAVSPSCTVVQVSASPEYVPLASNVGQYLAAAVTAYNEYGKATADSNLSEAVAAGATHAGWLEEPVDPPLRPDSVSCPSSSFCVAVDTSGNAITYNGSSWSPPQNIDGTVELISVSCPSVSFCLAKGRDGTVVTYNGSTWSAPKTTTEESDALGVVSCASVSFCVAVGPSGLAETYNGTSWSAPTVLDSEEGGLNSVSCPSASFCVAVGERSAWTYNGSSWSAPTHVEHYLASVSCSSPSFCVAVAGGVTEEDGDVVTYNGSSWSAPTSVGEGLANPGVSLSSVSCSSASFCVAVDSGAEAFTYNGSSWSAPTTITTGDLVSCHSASFCVAVESSGDAVTYNGSSWSAPTRIESEGELESVSCPSVSFCVAVDHFGNAVIYNGSSWSAPAAIDRGRGLKAVSCPSASFCVAVDESGNAVIYNGSSWGAPTDIDGGRDLKAVSCPTASFCVAVGFEDAVTYNGSSWSAPANIDSYEELTSVSCPSRSFCTAVDYHGHAVTYNGSSWSAPTSIEGEEVYVYLSSVSCPSTSFCVALGGSGNVVTYNGSSWSAPTSIEGEEVYLSSVSCPSTSFCVAVEGGAAITYNGNSWSAPAKINSIYANGLTSISCPSASFCVAVDASGDAVTNTTASSSALSNTWPASRFAAARPSSMAGISDVWPNSLTSLKYQSLARA